VEATGVVNATVTITTGTEIGIENVTAIVLPVVTTEIVVTGTRIGTGVIEGAPVLTLPIAGRGEATLAARFWEAPDVLANVIVINPKKSWWCSAIDSRLWDASHYPFQVVKFREPFTVLYQDFKLKLFRQLA